MSKIKILKTKPPSGRNKHLVFWLFEFWICFAFRDSDFEFNQSNIGVYIIVPYNQCSKRTCAVVLIRLPFSALRSRDPCRSTRWRPPPLRPPMPWRFLTPPRNDIGISSILVARPDWRNRSDDVNSSSTIWYFSDFRWGDPPLFSALCIDSTMKRTQLCLPRVSFLDIERNEYSLEMAFSQKILLALWIQWTMRVTAIPVRTRWWEISCLVVVLSFLDRHREIA